MVPGTAWGLWGGEPDGDDHPNVGATFIDRNGDGAWTFGERNCTGFYAGPSHDGLDVFVTAGHCVPIHRGIPPEAIRVSFDTDTSDGVDGLIPLVSHRQMPGFAHDAGDVRDLGVMLLPAGSVAAPAASLPPAGYLDDLKAAGNLQHRIVDIVGYGWLPDRDDPGKPAFANPGVRNAGTSKVKGLGKAWIRYQQSADGNGTGSGVCFGDSGSPQFEQGTFVAISVTNTGDRQCRAHSVGYRLDTSQARGFLGELLTRP